MMKMRWIVLLPILILNTVLGQDFGVEMWREHLPYANVINVAQSGSRHYAATPYGLYFFDEEDNALLRMSTINGLNDFEVNVMGYNMSQDAIIVGYKSGNIDLVKGDRIININAILASNVVGDKAIYGMHSDGDLVYLGCGFGIVVLNTEREEIEDTYLFGVGGVQFKVNDITTTNSTIYAATSSGIYLGNKNNSFLSDFGQWSQLASISHFNDEFSLCHNQNGLLYCNLKVAGYSTDTIFIYDDINFDLQHKYFDNDFFSIEPKDQEVIISHNVGVICLDENFAISENLYTYADDAGISPNQCIWDGEAYWIADRNMGMNKSVSNWDTKTYRLSGPKTNECVHLTSNKNSLWVSTGYVNPSNWNNTYKIRGVYHFDQLNWSEYNRWSYPELNSNSIFDFIHVAIDPNDDDHVFFSTFTGGIIEFNDDAFIKQHTHQNSSLQTAIGFNGNQVKISGSAYDNNGNLWVANSFAAEPLTVILPDGSSQSFSCGSSASNKLITAIMVNKSTNYVWLAIKDQGIIVYNYNNTPEDASDDQFTLLTQNEGSGNLPSAEVNAMVEDRDGEVWIGTIEGPAVIYSPYQIFESGGDYDAQKVLLEQDGSFQFLLETQSINEIVVDGANRKWFGTNAGGIFLMSEDGTEQIYAFNTENSPIFSNTILALAMNEITGELYVGTDRGVMGFKGSATEPQENFSDVYAFPNPVRPEYDGLIAIRGLMDKSDIKITDASGSVVYSGTSLGGQAVWNGRTPYGQRVQTGIYFVFFVNEDGSEKEATKILFIN